MATVKISIPVRTMGYTGQRDQWESQAREFAVYYDGTKVRLVPSGYGVRGFEFSEAELKTALDFIREQGLEQALPESKFTE